MTDRNMPRAVHTVHAFTAPGRFTVSGKDWKAAIAMPYPATFWERVTAAWWVLRGRAHAVRWPQVGELEAALRTTVSKP